MGEETYSVREALTDLMQAGLLKEILLPVRGALVRFDPSDTLGICPVAAFHGAGLDSRQLPKNGLFVALDGQTVDGRKFTADVLKKGHWVLTRAMDSDFPDPLQNLEIATETGVLLSPDPEKALAHLAKCWRDRLKVTVVAVTGTNGKTTTKDLMLAMLSAAGKTQATPGNLNNHLGLPLTLLNLAADTKYAVIEMGASAVGEISFLAALTRPRVAVITNASHAHLREFGSLDNIIQGKGEILDALPWNGTAILNADSPGFDQWRKRAICIVVTWGLDQANHVWFWQDSKLVLDGETWVVPLPGRHNGANLCAAILACRALGVEDWVLRKGLEKFKGSAHRGLVFEWEGRSILDDSYNANPVSMLIAVQALEQLPGSSKTIAVLGAMAELGTESVDIHRKTGKTLGATGLDHLIAVGPDAYPLAEGYDGNAEVHKVQDHHEAADWLRSNTSPGDRILIKGSRSSAMETILRILSDFKKKPGPGVED